LGVYLDVGFRVDMMTVLLNSLNFWCMSQFFLYFRMDIERMWVVDGTGLAVSPRHPYMFSAGDDKQVKCWDLEYNKVLFPLQIFTFT
jgi:WD40 repeat protein